MYIDSQIRRIECQTGTTDITSTHLSGLPNGTVGADLSCTFNTDREQLHADAVVAVSFEFDAIALQVQYKGMSIVVVGRALDSIVTSSSELSLSHCTLYS